MGSINRPRLAQTVRWTCTARRVTTATSRPRSASRTRSPAEMGSVPRTRRAGTASPTVNARPERPVSRMLAYLRRRARRGAATARVIGHSGSNVGTAPRTADARRERSVARVGSARCPRRAATMESARPARIAVSTVAVRRARSASRTFAYRAPRVAAMGAAARPRRTAAAARWTAAVVPEPAA